MRQSVWVKLSWAECQLVAHIGATRRVSAIFRGRKVPYGEVPSETEWGIDIEGAGAEYVVAQYLDLFWGGCVVMGQAPADVGAHVQVRQTTRANGRLIVHDSDRDDQPFVLVRGCLPNLEMVGWIMGHAAKQRPMEDPKGGRPAYFVPDGELRAMDELRRLLGTANDNHREEAA
jgi:hypothetical protein